MNSCRCIDTRQCTQINGYSSDVVRQLESGLQQMQGAPLEIHLEIVRHLRLRDFKAFRRTCTEFSKVVTRDYQRYRWECATLDHVEQTLMCMNSNIWWQLHVCKTVREFVDHLDECEEPTDRLECMEDVHSRAIRTCAKFKLWDTSCDLNRYGKTTLWINGKKLTLVHERDCNKVREATINDVNIFGHFGGRFWTLEEGDLAEKVAREIVYSANA